MQYTIALVGLNHRTAPVEIRERFALSETTPADLDDLQDDGSIREIMLLSTCNRVEVLAVSAQGQNPAEQIIKAWEHACGAEPGTLAGYTYVHSDLQAVRHVFRVASSLDSMVLGEPQILGQLKDAYRLAVDHNTSRVIINRLMHKAFSVAKRIRTETAIAQSAVSISYAAVELAKEIFGDLSRRTAMLVGAGEMAELAAAHLINDGIASLLVTNRTLARAQELAQRFQGQAVPFSSLFDSLNTADIVISSTGASQTVIQARDMRQVLKKRKYRPIFFIDIAVPRDIDPDVNRLDNVYLYDIDDLKGVVEENLAQRREEAQAAEVIVEEEVLHFEEWLKSLALTPTIVDLLEHGESIAHKEIQKTLKNLGPDVSPEVVKAIETLGASLSRKLYHFPITFLKRRSQEEDSCQYFVSLIRRMFDLDQDVIPEDAHAFKKKK